jgi:hypothetical protein
MVQRRRLLNHHPFKVKIDKLIQFLEESEMSITTSALDSGLLFIDNTNNRAHKIEQIDSSSWDGGIDIIPYDIETNVVFYTEDEKTD